VTITVDLRITVVLAGSPRTARGLGVACGHQTPP